MPKYTRDYIQNLLRRAKKADPNYNITGADFHHYQLKWPTTIERIRNFENKFHIKLPNDYVYFLTEIGNGGAGPDCGLYSLYELYEEECCKKQSSDKKTLYDSSLNKEKWYDLIEELENIEDDDIFEAREREIYQGILVISKKDYDYDNILICSGDKAGEVAIFREEYYGQHYPFFTNTSFLDWYVGYFEDIIAGMDVSDYGYYKRGSEQELLYGYENASNLVEKMQNLYSLERYHHLSLKTIKRLYHKQDYETDTKRLSIIIKHNHELGIALFNRFINGEHISAAVDVINKLPIDIQPRYYHRVLEILYQNIKCDHITLIKYLGNQKQTSTNDIIPLIRNYHTKSLELYKIFKLLENLDDLKEYELFFIRLLYEAEDGLVRDILIYILDRDKPSDALLDAYYYLYKKFPKNSFVQSISERELKKYNYKYL